MCKWVFFEIPLHSISDIEDRIPKGRQMPNADYVPVRIQPGSLSDINLDTTNSATGEYELGYTWL